jgi:hypothetical protein
MSAKLAAEWMASRVAKDGILYQDDAAEHIATKWNDCVVERDDGGTSIVKPVLTEFQRLTADTVVWERAEKCWRKRETTDGLGRQAD